MPVNRKKLHQLPYVPSSHVSSDSLELIHTDIWGPTLLSINNSMFYVYFIDEYNKFVWIYFPKNKFNVEFVFLQFR